MAVWSLKMSFLDFAFWFVLGMWTIALVAPLCAEVWRGRHDRERVCRAVREAFGESMVQYARKIPPKRFWLMVVISVALLLAAIIAELST